jgi:SET domain-containing protein
MVRKPFRVGRSNTGLGLFATEIINKGDFIVEYKGRLLRNAEADAMADRGSKYLYEINSRWTIDGSSRKNIARYANHSCRPNAESDVTRERKVVIRAVKKIRPGDEITYDYGRDYFNLIIKPMGCRCAKCVEKQREERRLNRLKAMRAKKRALARRANGHG